MENKGKKLAVLVGILYPTDSSEISHLEGCINDVEAMKALLISRFGFDSSNIEVITDGPESKVQPTGANIRKALNRMVEKAQEGDILFFHFSGHGTRHSLDPNHPDKLDEAIVPCDKNLIYDVDFRNLVNQLPKGATLTILSDSCHSGELIAQEKEQIGPSTHIQNSIETPTDSRKPRFIPIESILRHLSSQTGLNTPDIGTHLLSLFGSEASLKFRLPRDKDTNVDTPYQPDGGILLSGCQKDEVSEDLWPGGTIPVVKACGAFSNAVQIALKKHEEPITNKELVKSAREVLHEQKIDEQHPCLYCSDANASATFLMQQPKI